MARDAGNTKQNKRLEQLGKLRDEGDDAALLAVLATPDGRRVLSRILRDNNWMAEVYDAASDRQTAYNAGRQKAAVETAKWAERVSPDDFMTALRDAAARDVEMNDLSKAAITQKDEDTDG